MPTFYDLAGFDRDENGVYHAQQDALQQYAGYNDLYDEAFDAASSMAKNKFPFSTKNGKYMIWLWKGDYLNLGAGAETGLYSGGGPHWNCDTTDKMPMTLSLEDEKGNQIFDWNPQDTNWWCTGFNPEYQDRKAPKLTAKGSVDFSDPKYSDMWDDFYEKYYGDSTWTFDEENHIAKYEW